MFVGKDSTFNNVPHIQKNKKHNQSESGKLLNNFSNIHLQN